MSLSANNSINHNTKSKLACIWLSAVAGIATGILISLFKYCSGEIFALSSKIYAIVRENTAYLPYLVLGAAILGLTLSLLLKFAPDCRGGGIPTALTELRGQASFNWIKTIFILFPSAMITYLCGVPLGTEGPSVQMGTSVGRGTVRLLSKKEPAWDRYIMTGGACAGFAAATGAPLTGILFAIEEAHRRFSPLIFISAAVAVCTGTATAQLACHILNIEFDFLNIEISKQLSLAYIWAPVIVGIVCGLCAVLFTKLYYIIRRLTNDVLKKTTFSLKVSAAFVLTAFAGFALSSSISSGHSLIHELTHSEGVIRILIIVLCIRAILLLFANNIGVTGGLFVPTLTFGALIGSILAGIMTKAGILSQEYYIILVATGMVAFLAAASRTPLTALAFGVEALCGLSGIIFIVAGITVSYLVIELLNVTAFNDTVIEQKIKSQNEGLIPKIVDSELTVQPGAFVIGKEIRDILWPPTCTVLSVVKNNHTQSTLCAGDVLHVHYSTYSNHSTAKMLFELVGTNGDNIEISSHLENENESVPEN